MKNKFLCNIMNSLILSLMLTSFIYANKDSKSNKSGLTFIENKGQVADFDGNLRNEFLYYIKTDKLDVYFRKEGITYIFKKGPDIPSNSLLSITDQEKAMRAFLEDKTLYYRMDVDFKGMNANSTLNGTGAGSFYYNFYQAHCPDGIMNVKSFEKITYENLYDGIDFTFYFYEGKFKYDVILKPGANINNIHLLFNGVEDLQLLNNTVIINSPVGEILETLPKSFIRDLSGNEKDEEVVYILKGNEVRFQSDYNHENMLVIDPQISWTTYYDDCFWNGLGSSIDVKGTQCVISSYAFNNNFPTLDPGGSAYYQNTNAGSGDFRILKFDTDGIRIWATYYGGTGYDNISHIKLDYNGSIILAGHTESTNIPCQNAGGYYDATYDAGAYGGGTFIVKFNSSGVRQWGTHYDYVSYPFVEVDLNNNVYVVGRSEYNDPPVLSLAGAYNQPLVSHDAGGSNHSSDIFIVKFNSSTVRTWATNLGSTTDEFPQDLKCGSDNYLNILGISDCYSGTGLITQNPLGGAYYDNTTGPSASNRDDALLYRFNTSGAMFWGTAFGGTANDNVQQGRITTDNANNIYIYAETSNGTIPFTDPGGGAYFDNTFQSGGSGFNPFIARFTSGGVLNWCTFFGSYGLGFGMNFSNFLGVSTDNKLIVVITDPGGVGGTHPLVPRVGDYNATLAVYMGVYIAEFNSNLNVAYSTYYAGTTDRHTLGDAVLSSNSCGYELYMTTNWEKWDAAATDPPWVKPIPASYQNTTFFTSTGSGLITRFSNLPSVAPTSITASINPICSGNSTTLTVNGGSLGTGATWQWYSASCGGTSAGSGTSISVSPTGTTTYYVAAVGTCNTTTCASVTVTVNPPTPATPGAISNPTPVCPGSSQTYSISTVTNATTYTWTVPAGWTITGGNGTTSITVTAGSAGQNGDITVTAGNSCGTSAASTLAVVVSPAAPATPGVISGPTPVCPGTSQSYSISSVTNATTYNWTVPSGWTITGGNGTTSITVTAGSAGQNGDISVTAGNSCGTSAASTLAVVVSPATPATPGVITGPTSVCPGTSQSYSISTVTNATTYTWTVPAGWTITGGNGTTSITVTSGSAGQNGTITVTAGNSCGTSAASTLNVSVTATVAASVSISASSNPVCENILVTFNATPDNGGGTPSYQWYLNGVLLGITGSAYSNSSLITGDQVYCVMTSSSTCVTGSPATSNTITMTVNNNSTDPTSISASPNPICQGTSTTLTVNGGSLGLGADWVWYENGCASGVSVGNGPSISVSPSSTVVYYVRAEGACNNTSCVSIVINVTTAPNAGTNGVVSTCEGEPSFNLFSELGGTPSGGGLWTDSGGNPASNIFDPSTQSSAIFTYTVAGTSPCSNATSTVTVTVNPLPIVSFTGLNSSYCGLSDQILLTGNHAPDGTFTGVDITDNGNGTALFTFATFGTHTVTYTYTDINGCSASDIQSVTIYPLPNVAFTGLNSPYCAGDPQFNIIGNHAPSGTFSPALIDNGDGTATINPSAAGIHNITYSYTDGNGCSSSDVQQLVINEIPTVNSLLITDVTVCSSPFNGEIIITATGGAGVYEYSIDGGTYSSVNTFSGLNVGVFTISILDTNNCSLDTIVTVDNNTGFNIDSVSVTDILCFGDTSAQLTIYSPNAVSYSIDNGLNYGIDSIFYNLGAGTYNIMTQDAGNCTDVSIINISEPPVMDIITSSTDASCSGNDGIAGVIVSGGTSPYYFIWSNDSTSQTITGLSSGNYYITITDFNGCAVDTSIYIGSSGNILSTSISSIVSPNCFGDSDGSATVVVSGTGPFDYYWSNGDTTATISGVPAGIYYVTVSDQSGCSGIDTVNITQPNELSYNDSIINIRCFGYNDGQIYLNISGGTPVYSYSWIGPNSFISSDEFITNLSAGGYYVTVTDVNGCSFSGIELTVSEPEKAITMVVSSNPPVCYNNADGVAIATVTGGTPPYSYLWSNSGTGTSISNLASGEYYITVIDGNSCTEVDTFSITSPGQIITNVTISDASCIGNNDGEIILSGNGGVRPYTYVWNTEPVQNDSSAINLTAGDYSVTISDFNNCEMVFPYTVSDGTEICLEIPNVFTPNGDGVNDTWEISRIHLYPEVKIEIFNRWGDVIYTYSGSGSGYKSIPWDGTFNGKELPISSYVYIIDLMNDSEAFNGIVTIKK